MSAAVPNFHERWCPNGQHWVRREQFDARPDGVLRRDCRSCRAAARAASVEARKLGSRWRELPGVNIDALHTKLRAGLALPGVKLLKKGSA